VVFASTATAVTVASTTPTDSGLTATITPTLSTSKILVIYSQSLDVRRDTTQASGAVRLLRGATVIQTSSDALGISMGGASTVNITGGLTNTYLDEPATTSATTYKAQININTTASGGGAIAQANSSRSSITLIEIGA
jgi:hypothetical protein